MGNCFTNTATQNIVQITPPPQPANGEHGKPPSPPPKPAPPKPSGPPPLPNPMLPGSSNPACGVVGWSTMDVWSLYILERELWSGQFWTTYLCTERATGLKYVCKSASKLPGAYVDVVGYMRREVAILQRLCGQPNIATFRAAFEDADSLHLVMEFCSGGELFDRRVAAKGGYSERQAAALCRDVLTVVHVCHSMGVMHRDLRPDNFRLASSAEGAPLKAIDFGLSVFIEEGKVYKEIVGSAYYVAPEVLQGNYGREIDVWSAGVILYILLCGSPPFWAETEKGIFDAILVGQVDLRSSPWPTISESAKDLIRQMLNRDPHKRITAAQALEHPWLKESGASDRPIDSPVLSRTKQFKEMNKLKQLALKKTAEDPDEEVKGPKQMFDNMDTDKSGTITLEEQKIGLTKLGSEIGEAEVQKLMEEVDVDKRGNIDHTEFMPAMVNKDKLEKEEDLLPASQHLDKDNIGHRAHGEKDASRASKRSKSSGRKNDKKEAEQELNKPVSDNNVVMEEVPSSQPEQLSLKETTKEMSKEVEGLKQMFDNTDTNKSGTITREEQKIGFTKLGSKIGKTEVQKLMEAVDVDKRGKIDHTEFMPAMVNKDKLKKEEDLLPPSQHLDKDNNGANGDKDASRASKRSKSSGRKNDKKEAEQPVNDNVVMKEVPSSQVEPDKKLEEEFRKKMLAQKLAGGSGVNISGNNEQHVQDNSMQETGVGVGNTEREVSNYKYQDKNHVEVEDVTNNKQTQEIQGMNQDGMIDTNESTSGTSISGIDRVKVNSTQGIAGTDKEYFADEARRKSGRTDIDQKMMDKPVERIKAKNLEAVLGENA